MSDEQQIRDLIEGWAAAVHSGDLPTVLADHDPEIVMFDVPPPEQGIRGLAAYRDSWPAFLRWQAAGAVFEIETLDVTAGADVAFAVALLRCGTAADLARRPAQRLRLTVGLRRIADRWIVTHEHHSFPDATTPADIAIPQVRAVLEHWFDRTAEKDLDGLMEHIAPDIVSFEHGGPLQYEGIDQVRQVCKAGLESAPATITFDIPDPTIRVDNDLAVAWGIDHVTVDGVLSRSRSTRVFERRGGDWQLVHQHLSNPAATTD